MVKVSGFGVLGSLIRGPWVSEVVWGTFAVLDSLMLGFKRIVCGFVFGVGVQDGRFSGC